MQEIGDIRKAHQGKKERRKKDTFGVRDVQNYCKATQKKERKK